MNIKQAQINQHNDAHYSNHKAIYTFLYAQLVSKNIDVDSIITKLSNFQIAIPSWALGAGGTRFGRFGFGGEPATLEQKIEDIGLLHSINQSSGAISLHIPWDIPTDVNLVKNLAKDLNISFDAVNSNTFQDQANQTHSYKFGSLCNTKADIRKQAVEHNLEVIEIGKKLGSKALTVWLADGANFPGQINFSKAFENTLHSLESVYKELPPDWKMLVEYKPYEPNFYSMVIQDWGSSFMLANALGDKAYSLVDLGHHLPNTNIEQIVALLLLQGKLGGFHFNDSKYGDDDLTVGSIKPYQLFLIFNELVSAAPDLAKSSLAWMIDASHNIKDPLEDLLQSVEAIKIAYAQALLVDKKALEKAQNNNDTVAAQEILQDAYRTDVRPLLAESRWQKKAALNPVKFYRKEKIRAQLIKERGSGNRATGL